MIVIEFIPFLLLAIGGNNIFLIVKDIQQEVKSGQNENSDVRSIVVKAFSRHMGSILSCGVMEMSIFKVGIYSLMPAVKVLH